jgi:hypothetical protein
MTYVQQTRNASGAITEGAVHLLLTEGDVKMMVENPEQVMEEIRVRAEQVSSVLEGILLEPHGQPRWGLNE